MKNDNKELREEAQQQSDNAFKISEMSHISYSQVLEIAKEYYAVTHKEISEALVKHIREAYLLCSLEQTRKCLLTPTADENKMRVIAQ